MKRQLLPRRLSSLAVGTGLLLAGSVSLAVPAFADDAAASQSDSGGSDATAGSADGGATAPARNPRATKQPIPKFTIPPRQSPAAAPTDSDPAAAGGTDGGSSAASSSATTGGSSTSPTTTDQQSDSPDATPSTITTTTNESTTATPSPDAAAVTQQQATTLGATACDPDPSYLPLSVTASAGAYPGDNELISWGTPPSDATRVLVTVVGPAPSTTTAWTTTIDLSDPAVVNSAIATGLVDGDYSVTAVAIGSADDAAVCDLTDDAITASAQSFTISKTIAAVTTRNPISENDQSPIVVSLTGFLPGSTVSITVTDSHGDDLSEWGCGLSNVTIGDDGSFQIIDKNFTGYNCLDAGDTYTVTATSTGKDAVTATTTFVANNDPWVNPVSITIDQRKLYVGDTTVIHGSGYAPGSVVTFYWGPNSGNYGVLGTATADADGNVAFTWKVGDDADGVPLDTGSGSIYAVDDEGNYVQLDGAVAVLAEAAKSTILVQNTVLPTPVHVAAPVTYNYRNVSNYYYPLQPKPTRPQPVVRTGSAGGSGGGTLANTGADLSSLALLIVCLIGGGATALTARRRFAASA